MCKQRNGPCACVGPATCLQGAIDLIETAKYPTDLFGERPLRVWRSLANLTHPDRHTTNLTAAQADRATAAFRQLTALYKALPPAPTPEPSAPQGHAPRAQTRAQRCYGANACNAHSPTMAGSLFDQVA
jgi:hypothetical protein